MLEVIVCIALGMVPGYLLRRRSSIVRLANRVTLWAIYILLFMLGSALGGDTGIRTELPVLGLQGICIGFCATMGSVLFVYTARKAFVFPAALRNEDRKPAPSLQSALLGSGSVLAMFVAGLALAWFGHLPEALSSGAHTWTALLIMMFAIGVCLGFDLHSFLILREMREKALLMPALIIAGSMLGALFAVLITPGIDLRQSSITGLCLGYYSLPSLIITELDNPALGSTALMANMFREIFSLAACPVLVRIFGPLSPIAAAAATSMDTCLPSIAAYSGERYAVLSVFSGMLLTLLAPLLVTAALHYL